MSFPLGDKASLTTAMSTFSLSSSCAIRLECNSSHFREILNPDLRLVLFCSSCVFILIKSVKIPHMSKIHKNPKFHEPCDLVGLEILTWSYNYQQRYSWRTVTSDSTSLLKTETDFSFILCRITDAGVYLSCIWARQATPQQLELLYLAQGYLCSASKGYWHLPWYYHTFQISSTICVLWGFNPAQDPSGQLLMSLVLYFPLQNLVLCSHTDTQTEMASWNNP